MKVRNDYVLVAETEREEKTAGGIILSADTKLDKTSKPGVVLAYGPNVNGLFTGDRVFLQWSESMPVNVDGRAAVLIQEKYIKAYIRSDATGLK